ncbi:MAG: fumarate hydratase [Candidatus Thiodiazotropha sp.]|nr:fumarate hydratase [Candidatus Thiodiazotropha taylori]MBT3057907.1 fumarate hydratase [Candidatus Thiodiazotropha sp. (ex Lucina pensylvanica)]MBT3064670.1 fumarate hydratase [Candidatus Thiodiazotropha sp. (ex Lucina pensylvanica)]MBV2095033.1 fumarate hydratase [Candidatus Thiodiazotropha sp. (ex Codakia orbicularis)]
MSVQESNKLRVNLNPISLEADLAYFGARLELVGEPETSYQAAQLKVYKALEAALEENLKRLRKKESRAKAKKEKRKGKEKID